MYECGPKITTLFPVNGYNTFQQRHTTYIQTLQWSSDYKSNLPTVNQVIWPITYGLTPKLTVPNFHNTCQLNLIKPLTSVMFLNSLSE